MANAPLDIALLVPFEPLEAGWVDPRTREVLAAHTALVKARHRFEEFVGVAANAGERGAHRSLTAVLLATCLERAGLAWKVVDPGAVQLAGWRRIIRELGRDAPRVVGISSTFVVDGYWLATLCALVRQALPRAQLVVGGYFYAENTEEFLSLDADVLVVGEGERRIVDIVRAVRDRRPLDPIPGLYIREGSRIRYTGDPEPLALDEQPLADWSLAGRIEPPVDVEGDAFEHCVETQRGCIFKCEFCTFRTLAAPVEGSVERGVRAILDAGKGRGDVFVVDATFTSPRDRFRRVLERLAEAGGSPLPLSAFARVSDLDDEICALMARAGFRHVRIGQESGDQRMLNAMKKGTRLDQVAPAIGALGRHGIAAFMFFMYGFPGETRESLAATRRLVRSLNDGHESAPIVIGITHTEFRGQALAGVQQRGVLRGSHRYDYDHLEITPAEAIQAGIDTFLELSRIPHAPLDHTVSGRLWGHFDSDARVGSASLEFFRWGKAVDRAIGLFLEAELEGTRTDFDELGRLRQQILARVRKESRRGRAGVLGMRALHRVKWRALDNWVKGESVPGLLTRSLLAWEAVNASGRLTEAAGAFGRGRYPRLGYAPSDGGSAGGNGGDAEHLVKLGVATGRRRLARAR